MALEEYKNKTQTTVRIFVTADVELWQPGQEFQEDFRKEFSHENYKRLGLADALRSFHTGDYQSFQLIDVSIVVERVFLYVEPKSRMTRKRVERTRLFYITKDDQRVSNLFV